MPSICWQSHSVECTVSRWHGSLEFPDLEKVACNHRITEVLIGSESPNHRTDSRGRTTEGVQLQAFNQSHRFQISYTPSSPHVDLKSKDVPEKNPEKTWEANISMAVVTVLASSLATVLHHSSSWVISSGHKRSSWKVDCPSPEVQLFGPKISMSAKHGGIFPRQSSLQWIIGDLGRSSHSSFGSPERWIAEKFHGQILRPLLWETCLRAPGKVKVCHRSDMLLQLTCDHWKMCCQASKRIGNRHH